MDADADGTPAIPRPNTKVATLRYVLHSGAKDEPAARSTFCFDTQTWSVDKMRPTTNAIVIYARANGGFSVWDPARSAFHFELSEVWEGLDIGGSNVCEGSNGIGYAGSGRRRPSSSG